jgi:hypothetical protein
VSPLEREKDADTNPQLPTRCVSIAEEEECESLSLVKSSPDQKPTIPARYDSIVEETTEDISARNPSTAESNATMPARHCSIVEDTSAEVFDPEYKNKIAISTRDKTGETESGLSFESNAKMPMRHCSIVEEQDASVASTGSHDEGHDKGKCCAPETSARRNETRSEPRLVLPVQHERSVSRELSMDSNAKMPRRHCSVVEDPSSSSTQDASV